MPDYLVTDSQTGRRFKLTGDSPPTEAELAEIFGAQTQAAAEPSPRAGRRADLQAQQRAAREEGVSTSLSARAAAGIEQGLRTPEVMIRGGLDALQYYRALDAVTGGDYARQNQEQLAAFNARDQFLAREAQAIEGRDTRNFVGDLVQGVARGVVELPPQLMAGAAGAMRGAAVQASAAMGGAQGALTQFAQERGEGRSQLEALPPAIASGFITAVTTRAFGDSGVEAVFRNEGVQGFRRRLVSVLREAGMEGAEEFTDQVQQDLLERATRNPGKPLGDSLYDTMQALGVGTVIGGAANAPRLLQRPADRPAVIVNEETGTTSFPALDPDLDELPGPSSPSPSPATPPMPAAPAATAEAATPGLSETIVTATVQPAAGGKVFTGPTHAQAYELMRAEFPGIEPESVIAGFQTSTGRVVSREEAARIAGLKQRRAESETLPGLSLEPLAPSNLPPSSAVAASSATGIQPTPAMQSSPVPAALPTPSGEPPALPTRASFAELPPVPGVPEPLEGQPYDTRLENRPEAAMETRPSAGWTPDGPREPAVDPELAAAIAAVRAGYQPEMEAQQQPQLSSRAGARKATREGMARVEAAKIQLRKIINNPDLVGRQRADMIENGRNLIGFLQAHADTRKPLETGYEQGDLVAYTNEDAPEGFRSFIFLEGARAGSYGVTLKPEVRAAQTAKIQAEWRSQQDAARRIRESQGDLVVKPVFDQPVPAPSPVAPSSASAKARTAAEQGAGSSPGTGSTFLKVEDVPNNRQAESAVAAALAPAMTDIKGKPTGWRFSKNQLGVTLVSPDGKKMVKFWGNDASSGSEALRQFALAQVWAIENPLQVETPKGDLVVKPVFDQPVPAPSPVAPSSASAKVRGKRGAAAGGAGTITGSNERRGSAMPAEAGSTPAPTEADAPRISKEQRAASSEFDRLVLDHGVELGWVRRPDLMAQVFKRGEGMSGPGIQAKILQSRELAAARTRAASEFADLSKLDIKDPVDRAKLLPRLKEFLAPRIQAREQSKQFDQKVIQGQRPAEQADDVHLVSAETLRPGDTFTVQGNAFEVEQVFTDESGALTGVQVKDGPKFGVQTVGADQVLHIDYDSLERGEPTEQLPREAASAFSLAPAESVPEQQARLAQEQAQREAKAQRDKLAERAAKPLTGTTGDLGQGDLLAGPQDLFAPPTPGFITKLDAAIDALKTDPSKLQEGVTGLPVWLTKEAARGALIVARAIAVGVLKATNNLRLAVDAGVDYLRGLNLEGFNADEASAALEAAVLADPEANLRANARKQIANEALSQETRDFIRQMAGYDPQTHAGWQQDAERWLALHDNDAERAAAAYWQARNDLPGPVWVALGENIATQLNRLEMQATGAGNITEARRLAGVNGRFRADFAAAGTETGQTLNAFGMMRVIEQMSPFAWDVFAGRTIEKAGQAQRNRIQPTLSGVQDDFTRINQEGAENVARTPEAQQAARQAVDAGVQADADKPGTALNNALRLEASNTIETLPSVVRRAQAEVLAAWHNLGLGEQVRQQTGRAGQGIENSLWSAVRQRGGAQSTVSSVIAQVNRALHEQVNRTLGVTKEQFTNPATYLMRLRDALGNAEVMSRIWEQTRAAVGANLRAVGEMERLLVRIEAEIAELEAQAKAPLEGGPEVTAKDAKLRAQQEAARAAMLDGRNANIAEAIKLRRERLADVTAQLEEYRKMVPAWEAVMGMEVDVWGPNLIRGVLREQLEADGVRLRKAVSDHYRGLAGATDPLAALGTLKEKIIAASGLDPQAAERLAKAIEAEYVAQVKKERARVAKLVAEQRARAAERAARRKARQPLTDAESLLDAFEQRQTEWVKPEARKSVVRAIVRQALREGASPAGLDEQVVRGGLAAQLQAVGVPQPVAYRLAYEVWQARQAAGGGVAAVVAGRMKSLQVNLGRLIRQHWTDQARAGESLAEQIVGETGLPAEKAEQLADAILRRFKQLVQGKKERALRNLTKSPAQRQLTKPTVAQRLIETSNLGALDNETLWNAVAEKLGLPAYTPEASREVRAMAERLQQLPEGSVQRQDKTAALVRFIARQKGVGLADLGWAFWYANTLSGPFTHLQNVTSNLFNLTLNTATQLRDPRGVPQMLAATAKGFRVGLDEARAIVARGPGANRTKFVEQGQALENLDPGDFTGSALVRQWRYVARTLAAADAAFYFPAREQKAIMLARALARKEGKSGAAIAQRAQEIVDGTEQQRNLWAAQVDRERAQLVAMGERPDALWSVRRLEQLREQSWDTDLVEPADDYALRVTFNNKPYGFLGLVADSFRYAQRKVPGFRGVVPFVNIIANVVNESINYTPWGAVRGFAAGRSGYAGVMQSLPFEWSRKLQQGQTPLTPDAVTDLYAKAFVGTALVGAIIAKALANADDDDGENFQLFGQGPEDDGKRKALRETGWIPYSVRVNGRYYAIGNTPLAVPLGAAGNYLDAMRWDKRFEQADALNRFAVAMWGGAHVITQQSFIDGLANLLGAVDRRGRSDKVGDRMAETAVRFGSSFVVPNALRQLDRLQDPAIYDAKGIEGALMASIPFARREGELTLNAFGEPVSSSPWNRFASDAKPNIFRTLLSKGVTPAIPEKVRHPTTDREMTDAEHYRYVQLSGQAVKRRLESDPGIQRLLKGNDREALQKAVTAIVKTERAKARKTVGF